MQSLKNLSNETLHKTTQALVAEERKLVTSILWHLHEIQMRRLHLEMGYGTLFEYAVKALGYSEAAAGRRIAAMRLVVEVPEAEPALEKGDVSLSTLCTLQHFFQRKNEPVSKEEKKALVFSLQGKSRRECEKILAELDPQACAPAERERVLSAKQTEIRFIADEALMDKLQKIRELDARSVGQGASYLELFHRMADLVLKKLDPREEKGRKAQAAPPAEPEKKECLGKDSRARYIPVSLRREVWRRDQGRCTYQSPEGRRCQSRYSLEVDHRVPLALGGSTKLSNLRLLCRAHNLHQAVSGIGEDLMRPYLKFGR